MFVFVISLAILLPFQVYAGTATQIDWSGGDGIWGPVINWSSEFFADTDIEYFSYPSNIVLQKTIAPTPLEHTIDGSFSEPVSVYSADLNEDGHMDILGTEKYGHNITWWENTDGSGTSWTKHIIDSNPGGYPFAVYASDLNRNGYIDVMGAFWMTSEVAWWENVDGAGTTWTKHVISGDYNIEKLLYSADVNGDGWGDVLGGSENDNKVIWWDLTEYLPDGSLESSVLDVQESPDWQTLLWDCSEPAGTSVAFQVRASTSSSNMGAWSDTLADPCTLEGLLADEDNYFQYRAILTSADPLLTPTLHDVTVGWQPFTGTQEGSGGEVSTYALYGAQPNPALGHASLVFALPVNSLAELTVYDLSGRLVKYISDDFTQGVTEILVDGLASGVYIVRMISGEFTATRQFIVIE